MLRSGESVSLFVVAGHAALLAAAKRGTQTHLFTPGAFPLSFCLHSDAPYGALMKIAVMPGDGIGKEVIPQGLKVLDVVSRKFGFKYSTTDYPFGAEHYLETGITLPDSALKELAAKDGVRLE